MASLLKIGMLLVVVTFVMLLVHDAEADDDVKRKRVIIKVPQRIKHIYHHHLKKVHIHKKKPKKKPHKHVHVVVEEEEIVHPKWKSVKSSHKGKEGWDGWQSPSSFKQTKVPSEPKYEEELYEFEDEQETRESRTHGRGTGGRKRQRKAKRGKKKGGRSNSSASYADPSFEASYEIHHYLVDPEDDIEVSKGSKGKATSSSSSSTSYRGHSRRPFSRSHRRKPRYEERSPNYDYIEVGDEFDELYDRGPAYPERKEDPSWHQPRSRRQRHHQEGSYDGYHDDEEDTEQSESQQRHNRNNSKANKSLWTLPKVPEVNGYIDDNDAPGPGVRPGWTSGGFVPITTYTASVVQNSPALQPHILPNYSTIVEDYKRPPIPITTSSPLILDGKSKKNPGYLSQVSHTPEGMTISYRSHIGHSSDIKSPASSFQSVSFASKLFAR